MSQWNGYRRHLGEAVAEYLAYLASDGKAASTIMSRECALKRATGTLGTEIYVHSIEPHHMSKVWSEVATTRGNNSRIIDHNTFTLFFDWCETMKFRARFESPMSHITKPRTIKTEKSRVPVTQFPALLTAASTFPRDRMFVANGLYMLCRKVELSHIRWGDVNRESGEVIITRFKTYEDDVMPISDELASELDYYEDYYRFVTETPKGMQLKSDWFVCPASTRPLFGPGGKRLHRGYLVPNKLMDKQTGTSIVKKALIEIGFDMRNLDTGKSRYEGAHTLRRSGARALYDSLVDRGHDGAIRLVQMMLGHKSMAQTEEYIGLTLDRKLRNDTFRGTVMYPKAEAVREENAQLTRDTGKYGHLRVVS